MRSITLSRRSLLALPCLFGSIVAITHWGFDPWWLLALPVVIALAVASTVEWRVLVRASGLRLVRRQAFAHARTTAEVGLLQRVRIDKYQSRVSSELMITEQGSAPLGVRFYTRREVDRVSVKLCRELAVQAIEVELGEGFGGRASAHHVVDTRSLPREIVVSVAWLGVVAMAVSAQPWLGLLALLFVVDVWRFALRPLASRVVSWVTRGP